MPEAIPMGALSAWRDGAEAGAWGETPLERMFNRCAPAEERGAYEPERRSLRVAGHCTTIRLERAFWSVLDEISAGEGMTVPEIIAQVQSHCQRVNDKNLASCLRVLCLRYLNTRAASGTEAPDPEPHPAPDRGARMELDTRGLGCPQPILKTKQALHSLASGEALRVITSDLGSAMDFEAFCRSVGHHLLWERHTEETFVFLIRKG